MKKIFTLIAAAMVAAGASAQTLGACKYACNKFVGPDIKANNGASTTITPTFDGTDMEIVMALDKNGTKYRGDITMGSSTGSTLFTTDATNDKYIAIKFNGAKPGNSTTITMEYKKSDNSTSGTATIASSAFKTVNDGTNDIVYCSFDDATGLTTGSSNYGDIVYWKFKISGATVATTYKIDWIATMNEAPTATTVWNDDPSDNASSAIFNNTTFTGYTSLLGTDGALKTAAANDVIVMNQDEEISARLEFSNSVVLDGNGHSIIRKSGNTANLMILASNNTQTIKNLVVDGNNIETTTGAVEVNKETKLNGCTFKNHNIPAGNAIIKSASSNAVMIGTTTLQNNASSHVFYLKTGKRIDDNDAAYTDGTNAVVPTIELASDYADGTLVVRNTATTKSQLSTSKYAFATTGWKFTEVTEGTDQYGLKATKDASAINTVNADVNADKAGVKKAIKNGQIIIVKDGKKFNVAGAQF